MVYVVEKALILMDTYLVKLEQIVASTPEKSGTTLYERVHDAWSYYADVQMRTGAEPHQCLSHARALARKIEREHSSQVTHSKACLPQVGNDGPI